MVGDIEPDLTMSAWYGRKRGPIVTDTRPSTTRPASTINTQAAILPARPSVGERARAVGDGRPPALRRRPGRVRLLDVEVEAAGRAGERPARAARVRAAGARRAGRLRGGAARHVERELRGRQRAGIGDRELR